MENQLSAKRSRLQEIEHTIREGIAQGRRAIRQIGAGFAKIQTQELWQAAGEEFHDFYAYAYYAFGMERWNVNYAINAERTFALLERAHLRPPLNESQAAALAGLNEEQQLAVWRRVVEECERAELGITVARIRDAVRQERQNGPPAGAGVDVDLGAEDELSLTEKGEEALARINALCGPAIESAIRHRRNDKITEDAVCLWAAQDDDTVIALPEYVFDRHWTVRKALNYLSQLIEGDTEIDELVLMARNRSGRFVGKYADARITIEILKLD
jgi:hypothetical protein